MSLDEPTMLGDTPEQRLRAQQRRKRIRAVAAVVIVILAVGVAISLIPTTPRTNFTVDRANSRCAAGGSLSCTIAIDPKPGYAAAISIVKSVQINGTNPTTSSVKMSGKEILVSASVPLPGMHCLPDIGCSLPPPTAGDVVVFLTDGTTVSAVIGATNGE
jgi:hypothetical protein